MTQWILQICKLADDVCQGAWGCSIRSQTFACRGWCSEIRWFIGGQTFGMSMQATIDALWCTAAKMIVQEVRKLREEILLFGEKFHGCGRCGRCAVFGAEFHTLQRFRLTSFGSGHGTGVHRSWSKHSPKSIVYGRQPWPACRKTKRRHGLTSTTYSKNLEIAMISRVWDFLVKTAISKRRNFYTSKVYKFGEQLYASETGVSIFCIYFFSSKTL